MKDLDKELHFVNQYIKSSSINLIEPKHSHQEKDEYFAIPVFKYLSGEVSFFDLYLRLSDDKYVKVLHKGESFLLDMLKRWNDNGVHFLFIKQEQMENYLKVQNAVLAKAAVDQKAPVKIRANIIGGQGERLISQFKSTLDPKALQGVNHFIGGVRNLIEEFHQTAGNQGFPEKFFSSCWGHEHGVSTVMMAGVVARGQKLTSEKPFRTVCLASMFHDVGLIDSLSDLSPARVRQLSPAERVRYEEHPLTSAALLAKFDVFDNSVLQAIRQHHMRVRGTSFPRKNNSEIISQTSAIVGMADELVYGISEVMGSFDKAKLPLLEKYCSENIFPGFNRPIVMTTQRIMFKK